MTEFSWPWDTVTGLGDGTAELNEYWSRLFLATRFGVQNPAIEGVCKGLVIGELEVSGAATPLSVDPGAGICYGLYINGAVKTLAVTIPAVGTTGGRVVLQTNWAGTGGAPLEARTRLAVKMSADGNPAIPALTQSFGITWEISLATFTITTGGVITVTDDRTFRRSTAMVDTDELIDLAVTTGKIDNLAVTTGKLDNVGVTTAKIATNAVDNTRIRDSTPLSVIGRAVNSNGDPADIAAAADNRVLARAASALSFQQVATAMIANDAVDDTKAGDRVPQAYRRRGGSATDWNTAGGAVYTPTSVRMQMGTAVTDGVGNATINYPVAFSAKPILLISLHGDGWAYVQSQSASAAAVIVYTYLHALFSGCDVYWLAIGPE